jgi:hypothetical protein
VREYERTTSAILPGDRLTPLRPDAQL